jgi:hypothetical protein
VTTIVGILLAAGSAYDIYLKRTMQKEFKGKTYLKITASDLYGTSDTVQDSIRAKDDKNVSYDLSGSKLDLQCPMEPMMIETRKLSNY